MSTDERKGRVEFVRQSEARLRAHFETASQGILKVRADGRIKEVNHRTEQMFGYRHEELVGQTFEKLLPDRFRAEHAPDRARYSSNLRRLHMGERLNVTAVRKDATEFPVEVALSFASSNRGSFATAFIVDISARTRLEQQIRQTQKLESLSVLAAGVAHDFNNLLTVIMGSASLLAGELPTVTSVLDRVHEIVQASERLADLTRQLLTYAGKGQFELVPVNCSDILRAVAVVTAAKSAKNLKLRLHLSQALPRALADISQTQQLVTNLIINGVEAIGEIAGTVDVRTAVLEVDAQYLKNAEGLVEPIAPGTYVVIEVEDTGCGMDEETKAKIFDPFFTTKFPGRGLGLAAVRGIIRSHKGGLQVHSTPGRGTIFRVLLPVAAEKELSLGRMDVPVTRDSDSQRRRR
jgi:PAS domain S-box-containing protein